MPPDVPAETVAPTTSPPQAADTSAASPSVGTTPSTPSTPEPSGAFEGLGLEEIEIDETTISPEPAKAEPKPAAADTVPTAPAQKPAEPVAEPKAAPQEKVQESPAPSSPPAEPQQQFLKLLSDNREGLIKALAASDKFKLTPEETAAFEEDALSVLPSYAGRVFYEAYASSVAKMVELVPAMVRSIIAETKTQTSEEDEFFSAYPGLKKDDPKHVATVNRMAKALRMANPSMPKAEFSEELAIMAMTALKVQAPSAASPHTNGNAPPAPPPSFKPAVGSAPRTPSPPVVDWFDGLDLDLSDLESQ